MDELINLARVAAERTVGETTAARHVATLDSGEHVFHVDCLASEVAATVSLNPNGHKACVEWPSGTHTTNYKICDLRDLADPSDDLVVTSEEPAIKD